jgi:hypothetical protein
MGDRPALADDDAPPFDPPRASPWTFAELLAPFLRGLHHETDAAPAAQPVRDSSEMPVVGAIPPMPPDESASFVPLQPEAPVIAPVTTRTDAPPTVHIGDIVVEITSPRPPAPPAQRRAASPPPAPRPGVRSKRGFGMGQM